MEEFLRSRGWEYGLTRQHGWRWAHRNLPRGIYFSVEAAVEIERVERISERELCHR